MMLVFWLLNIIEQRQIFYSCKLISNESKPSLYGWCVWLTRPAYIFR